MKHFRLQFQSNPFHFRAKELEEHRKLFIEADESSEMHLWAKRENEKAKQFSSMAYEMEF